MAAYTLRSTGALDQHNQTGASPIVGGQPAGIVAGDLLLINAIIRNNSYTIGTVPTGWVKLSPNINDTYNYIYARIATATAGDNFPALAWSGTAQAQGQMTAWFGDVYTDLSNIVHSVVDESAPGAGAAGNDIQYSALSVTAPNCLVIARGMHNKTTTSNLATINALAGFTQISQQNPNGSVFSAYWGYQQQTTATSLSAVIQTRTGTPENLQQSSIFLALKTASAGNAAAKAFFLNQQCTYG